MITLSKSGNTVTFTFDENSGYLQNGTIDVPVNSLALITDESDMATFRKSASNDIFISARYEEFGMSKAELEAWYKENMVGSTGGGVDSGTVQTMIDESISGKAESVSAVSSAEYVSSSTTINFKNVDGDVISSIDASDFVIDGMIDDVRIETISGVSYLVIDFNTASGKEDIQIPLTDIFDPSNYYTKQEVDASLSGKADTSAVTEAISAATDDMATKTWVGEQGYLTEHQSLSAYSTTEEVNSAITEATSGKVDTSTYNTYTANTATEIGNKLAVSDFNTYSGAVDTAINSKASESDLSALTDVVSAHTANTDIHVTTAQTAAWNAKSDFSGSYNDLTDKPTIPTVPTSNTAFTNDAGYATSGYVDSVVSGKVDTSTFETYSGSVETALSGKQDTLSAGTNITISGNVISAEGGGKAVSAGTNISITTGETADTINCTLPITASNRSIICGGYSNELLGQSSDSIIAGRNNRLYNYATAAFGHWNICSQENSSSNFGYSGNTLFSVGNGQAVARHNALDIRDNGDIYIADTNNTSTTNWYEKPMIKLQDQLGGGISSGEVQTMIDESISGKVDTSAVTSSVTSSSTDVITSGGVYAQLGGLKLQQITQADYDALVSGGTVDNSTIYYIVN